MKTATDNPPREYFFLQINGRINSMHLRYEDAVSAGLLLKRQFQHDDIKLYETQSGTDEDIGLHSSDDLSGCYLPWRFSHSSLAMVPPRYPLLPILATEARH